MDAMLGLGLFGLFGLAFLLALYVPLILYLANLQRCFDAIRPEFRSSLPTALVWLAVVPGLGILVLIVAVVLLSTALKKEDEARRSTTFGDGGLAVGLAACILGLMSWIPFLGLLLALGSVVCWILHWRKVSNFRKRLAGSVPAAAASMVAPAAREATQAFASEPAAKLVCVVGVLQGMAFPVGNGVLIGRSQEANIVVPDAQVSNRHAWVGPVNGRLVLRDLRSTNGSYLNDNLAAPVEEAELKDGDLVVLGKHNQMKFRLSVA